jgi:hypothetical protein
MAETTKALRSKESVYNHGTRLIKRGVVLLLLVGSIAGLSLPARADPPTANRVFANCTFTTGSPDSFGTLNSALSISSTDLGLLEGDQVQASYIIIYVRANPNDGQDLKNSPSFTGPILCTNADTDVASPTTEATPIPPLAGDTVNILGAEEASHLQYEFNLVEGVSDPEKRVCHTVAGNTDCFLIQPQPFVEQ